MTEGITITIGDEHAAAAVTNDNTRAEEAPPAEPTASPSGRLPEGESLGASKESLGAKKVYKSVDLVCAIVAYNSVAAAALIERGLAVKLTPGELAEATARKMLIEIADDAHPDIVLRALAAVGAPSSLDEVAQRLDATRQAGTHA